MSNKKRSGYFLTESTIFLVLSIIFLVLSIAILEESETAVVTLSVFTTVVVESVVVVVDPDPQAAKALTASTVNSFFIVESFFLIPVPKKGNPPLPYIFYLYISDVSI